MSIFSDSLIEADCTPQSNCCSGLFTMEITSIADSGHSAIASDLYVRTRLQIFKEKARFAYIVNSPLRIDSGLQTHIIRLIYSTVRINLFKRRGVILSSRALMFEFSTKVE